MAIILDGRALAERIRDNVKQRVVAMNPKPGLAVLLVGDDPASHLYVRLKRQACEEAGIRFELNTYPADEPEDRLIAKIQELNARADVTGILVQLPLPSQNADRVIAAIDPNKDVDGFHPENLRRLEAGEPGIVPALELGIMKLLDAARDLPHANAVIVGSTFFARPLKTLLGEQRIEASVVDPKDPLLSEKTGPADVIIVAVGQPGLITGEMIKPGAIVIDVGTTRVDEKTVGDVDRATVEPVAGAISPVPGGVGPMTVAMLLNNILRARALQGSPPSDA